MAHAGIEATDTQWHSASAGLQTVRALLQRVEALPDKDDALVDDLTGLEKLLVWADEHDVGWHLAADF